MRRLAFVRMFFQHGIEQASQPEPLNVTALLNMHDTAELFLQVAADHLSVPLPKFVPFLTYFELIAKHQPGGVKLLRQRAMDGLNDRRKDFKHRGTLPGSQALQASCADVRVFLEENTQLVFGIDFADIDMAEVIPQQIVRDQVRAATKNAAQGNLVDAMGGLALAYEDLFPNPLPTGRRSPIGTFGTTISSISDQDISAVLRPAPDDRSWRPAAGVLNLTSVLVQVIDATRELQRAMRVTAFGINYREFEHFEELTPWIDYLNSGEREPRPVPGYAPTAEDFEFCRNFVITAALRVAEQP